MQLLSLSIKMEVMFMESGARLPGFGFLPCYSSCVNSVKWFNVSVPFRLLSYLKTGDDDNKVGLL